MCRFYVKNYRLFDGDGDRLEEEQLDWQYTVNRTWGGQTLDAASHSVVTVSLDDVWVEVSIDAPFNGDPRPEAPAGSTWELWEHEVVELFLVGDDGHYLELEFGPFGHFLALQLDGPRSIVSTVTDLSFSAEILGDRWRGQCRTSRLNAPQHIVRAACFAIHGVGPARTYLLSCALPGDAPNFHQPDQFPAFPPDPADL